MIRLVFALLLFAIPAATPAAANSYFHAFHFGGLCKIHLSDGVGGLWTMTQSASVITLEISSPAYSTSLPPQPHVVLEVAGITLDGFGERTRSLSGGRTRVRVTGFVAATLLNHPFTARVEGAEHAFTPPTDDQRRQAIKACAAVKSLQ